MMAVEELSELELAVTVDRLASIISRRKQLEEEEKRLRETLKQSVNRLPAEIRGTNFVAKIEERVRYTIPKEAVRAKLGERMMKELQRPSNYVTVNIK